MAKKPLSKIVISTMEIARDTGCGLIDVGVKKYGSVRAYVSKFSRLFPGKRFTVSVINNGAQLEICMYHDKKEVGITALIKKIEQTPVWNCTVFDLDKNGRIDGYTLAYVRAMVAQIQHSDFRMYHQREYNRFIVVRFKAGEDE